jgi:hypothetical protein
VERVPTFNVRVKDGRVLVHPKPNPAGAKATPAMLESTKMNPPSPVLRTPSPIGWEREGVRASVKL